MCAASSPASSDASVPDDSVRAVVDAGGEPWERILDLLERRCHELPVGSVLELHSANPRVRSSLRGWCRLTGSTLLADEETGEQSAYRIKLPPRHAPGMPHPFPFQKPESS
ncbi:sulfurtransferase TusA family protein [Streptomyces sp. NPDC056192]|uniref:sulfurtransferase TusA family protein n=1 Tax=unclassified Streptomyces TaxID=2593676 RepID=UPI0035DE865E